MGRGALVFKGEGGASKKKKNGKSKRSRDDDAKNELATTTSASANVVSQPPIKHHHEPVPPQIQRGRGTITTSGSVVTGHGTAFMSEIGVGDALLVDVVVGQQEMRIVTMRLSDISLNLSSAFSQNMSTPVSFSFITKPRDQAKEAALAMEKIKTDAQEEERHRVAGSAGELVYRERTEHGNYRTKRVKVDGTTNRSDLLDLRAKKTSDKYC